METDPCFIADSNLADSANATDQAFNIAKDFRSYCGSGSTCSKRTKRLHDAVGSFVVGTGQNVCSGSKPEVATLKCNFRKKSKVASVRIFGETLKREAIDDSNSLSRISEVANEFCVRR
jgi:hypothetical protein